MKNEGNGKKSDASSRRLVQSVDRALTLLDVLAQEARQVSLHVLSGKIGLNPSTAHRLLRTLQAHDLVRQDPTTRHYGLGLKLLQLAAAIRNQLDIRQLARPSLERLAKETGENANLVILDGDSAVYIDQAPSLQPVRTFTEIGARVPLHCTGVGKVLLAYLPEKEREIILQKGLQAFTKNTITNPYRLAEELAKVQDQQFALDIEERQEQVRCIAVPIFDDQSTVIAAISISGPANRLTLERLNQLVPLVGQTGLEISAKLGYPGSAEKWQAGGSESDSNHE